MAQIYGFFSRTASTAFSDTKYYGLKNTWQNTAEILRNEHSNFMLVTVTFSHGKNFDHGRF